MVRDVELNDAGRGSSPGPHTFLWCGVVGEAGGGARVWLASEPAADVLLPGRVPDDPHHAREDGRADQHDAEE
jgi:hypothetical protein